MADKELVGAHVAHFVDVTRGAAYLSQSCAPEAGWAEADILAIISRLSGSFQAYYWWKNAGLSGGELVFLQNFNQLYSTLHNILNFTRLYPTLHNFTRFYLTLTNFTQLYTTLPNSNPLYPALPNFAKLYSNLPNFIQLNQVHSTLLNLIKLYSNLPNFTQIY
jgi:hypothetical protein